MRAAPKSAISVDSLKRTVLILKDVAHGGGLGTIWLTSESGVPEGPAAEKAPPRGVVVRGPPHRCVKAAKSKRTLN